MILHIFMYNVISDFSAVTPASEGRVNSQATIWHGDVSYPVFRKLYLILLFIRNML